MVTINSYIDFLNILRTLYYYYCQKGYSKRLKNKREPLKARRKQSILLRRNNAVGSNLYNI